MQMKCLRAHLQFHIDAFFGQRIDEIAEQPRRNRGLAFLLDHRAYPAVDADFHIHRSKFKLRVIGLDEDIAQYRQCAARGNSTAYNR